MPLINVDFYLVPTADTKARWLMACALIEAAYAKGNKVYVHCENQHDAELLDELLWTFKDASFIPHNLAGEGPEPPPPIQIGFAHQPRGYDDILINMAAAIPAFHNRFKRIIEIVPDLEAEKEMSRNRYREYRGMGYQLKTQNATSTA